MIEVILLPDRYDIFITDCRWIEVCQNIVLSKIDITSTIKQKNFKLKALIIGQLRIIEIRS